MLRIRQKEAILGSRVSLRGAVGLHSSLYLLLLLAAAPDLVLAKHHRQRKRELVSHIPAFNTTCYIWQPGEHVASFEQPYVSVRLLMFTP